MDRIKNTKKLFYSQLAMFIILIVTFISSYIVFLHGDSLTALYELIFIIVVAALIVIWIYVFTVWRKARRKFIESLNDIRFKSREALKYHFEKKLDELPKAFDYYCPNCFFQSNEAGICPKCKKEHLQKSTKK